MIVSVASGKGGTGKTMVCGSLLRVWPAPVYGVDLDVEEPNLHLFLRPVLTESDKAYLTVPRVDEAKCTYCGACADLCQFKAVSVMGQLILTFPEMCHGCGGCLMICPEKALSPGRRELGEISWGKAGAINFLNGRLRLGEAMSPPLMRLVKARQNQMLEAKPGDVIIDSPPGVSCPAVNAVLDSDVILLVTEPTPFGVYDFQLAWEAFRSLGKPIGAIINRAGLGNDAIYRFCREKGLPILGEIPYDRAIAEAYARGQVIADLSDGFRQTFVSLGEKIRTLGRRSDYQQAFHA